MKPFVNGAMWLAIGAFVLPVVVNAGDEAVTSQIDRWEERFNAGDAAGVAALYTEDGVLLPPGGEVVEGTAAIQEFWQSAIDADEGEVDLETGEMMEHGDKVVEIGTYSVAAEGQIVETGKYLVVWKKSNGNWLILRDIWNENSSTGS